MERRDLVSEPHRAERLFLLDLLADRVTSADFDADAFLAITPEKLYPLPVQRRGRVALCLECGSRSCRFRMFVSRVNIQNRQLRLPHSMRSP
jgi:hypothetical protein